MSSEGFKCPSCGKPGMDVLDSRPSAENTRIRRRRKCGGCQFRITTLELRIDHIRELADVRGAAARLREVCHETLHRLDEQERLMPNDLTVVDQVNGEVRPQ